jgi:hypothetical protein
MVAGLGCRCREEGTVTTVRSQAQGFAGSIDPSIQLIGSNSHSEGVTRRNQFACVADFNGALGFTSSRISVPSFTISQVQDPRDRHSARWFYVVGVRGFEPLASTSRT